MFSTTMPLSPDNCGHRCCPAVWLALAVACSPLVGCRPAAPVVALPEQLAQDDAEDTVALTEVPPKTTEPTGRTLDAESESPELAEIEWPPKFTAEDKTIDRTECCMQNNGLSRLTVQDGGGP